MKKHAEIIYEEIEQNSEGNVTREAYPWQIPSGSR